MPLLALLIALQGDARLQVRASLLQPRVTYAELGAWVQRTTGAPVAVTPAIRERKATVLVEDRPVRETMDRVAEALFLEWEATPEGGYTLKLAPRVANEEARIANVSAQASHKAALEAMDRLARFAGYTPEALQSALDAANTVRDGLKKETTEEGKAAYLAASQRAAELSSFRYANHYQAGAAILARLTPGQRAAILDGRTVYASSKSQPGFIDLPASVKGIMSQTNGMVKPESRIDFAVRYDPIRDEMVFEGSVRNDEISTGGSSQALRPSDEATYKAMVRDEPMNVRLREWATTDEATLATKLAPKKVAPEPDRPVPYRTLAEILMELHERTGLPIVADGFRTAVVARKPPEGATLSEWNRALNPWTDGRFRGYRPLLRTSKGWAMFRHPQYWRMLPREVPESAIRTLEAAWAKPGHATLDDLAAFAGRLTPAQVPWTGAEFMVTPISTHALEGNVPFLRLWNALAPGQRRIAATPAGIAVPTLSGPQKDLYLACLSGEIGSLFHRSATIAYFMPGGSPLPEDLRLMVGLQGRTQPYEWEYVDWSPEVPRRQHDWENDYVPCVSASLKIGAGESLKSFVVPLDELKPKPASQ